MFQHKVPQRQPAWSSVNHKWTSFKHTTYAEQAENGESEFLQKPPASEHRLFARLRITHEGQVMLAFSSDTGNKGIPLVDVWGSANVSMEEVHYAQILTLRPEHLHFMHELGIETCTLEVRNLQSNQEPSRKSSNLTLFRMRLPLCGTYMGAEELVQVIRSYCDWRSWAQKMLRFKNELPEKNPGPAPR